MNPYITSSFVSHWRLMAQNTSVELHHFVEVKRPGLTSVRRPRFSLIHRCRSHFTICRCAKIVGWHRVNGFITSSICSHILVCVSTTPPDTHTHTHISHSFRYAWAYSWTVFSHFKQTTGEVTQIFLSSVRLCFTGLAQLFRTTA